MDLPQRLLKMTYLEKKIVISNLLIINNKYIKKEILKRLY